MAFCINPACRREIDAGFAFCPACGADNRPPAVQQPVRGCKHAHTPDGPYCTNCGRRAVPGHERDEHDPHVRSMRRWFLIPGCILLFIGFYLLVLAFTPIESPSFLSSIVASAHARPYNVPGEVGMQFGDFYWVEIFLFGLGGYLFYQGFVRRRDWT